MKLLKKPLPISTCIQCSNKTGIVKPDPSINATLYCKLTLENHFLMFLELFISAVHWRMRND